MRPCSRLWRGLEDLAAPTLPVIWEQQLGEDHAVLAPYLRTTGERAGCYPCPIAQVDGCPRGIFEHDDGRIEAFCRSTSNSTCESVFLTKAELALREIDVRRLLADVAGRLGLSPGAIEELSGCRRTFHIGVHRDGARETPVYVTCAPRDSVRGALEHVLLRDARPLVMLTAESALPADAGDLLRARDGVTARLADLVFADAGGRLVAARTLAGVIRATGISETAAPYEFRREGKTWRVAYEGVATSVGHTIGMSHIAALLRQPHCEIHSAKLLDLLADAKPVTRGSSGEVLDEEALGAYRERLADIDQEIDEAAERGDVGGQERLQEEREQVLGEVERATGLGGRRREAANDLERARQAVSRALHRALDAIEKEHPDLAAHLRLSIQIGLTLTYAPDRAIAWLM